MFRVILALLATLALSGSASAQTCGPAGCPQAPGMIRVTAAQAVVRSGAIVGRQRWTPLQNAVSNAQARHQARQTRRGR